MSRQERRALADQREPISSHFDELLERAWAQEPGGGGGTSLLLGSHFRRRSLGRQPHFLLRKPAPVCLWLKFDLLSVALGCELCAQRTPRPRITKPKPSCVVLVDERSPRVGRRRRIDFDGERTGGSNRTPFSTTRADKCPQPRSCPVTSLPHERAAPARDALAQLSSNPPELKMNSANEMDSSRSLVVIERLTRAILKRGSGRPGDAGARPRLSLLSPLSPPSIDTFAARYRARNKISNGAKFASR